MSRRLARLSVRPRGSSSSSPPLLSGDSPARGCSSFARRADPTHWPWRGASAARRSRRASAVRQSVGSGGQAAARHPNAVLLYPSFPARAGPRAGRRVQTSNYFCTVLWAFFRARALARRLGLTDGAAFLSGVAFAFSDDARPTSAVLNSIAAAACCPGARRLLDLRGRARRARIRSASRRARPSVCSCLAGAAGDLAAHARLHGALVSRPPSRRRGPGTGRAAHG